MQLKVDEEVKKLGEILLKIEHETKLLEEFFKSKISSPPTFSFTGLVKVYADAVKDSDGLTIMRPATVKAVQTAEKSVTEEHLSAAVKELEAHVKDVTKTHGLDKSKKKELGNFTNDIHLIVNTLKEHLK